MKILVYMSGGFDTQGPSNHLFLALMEDILKKGHYIHLIERHTKGEYPDVPKSLKANPRFSFDAVLSKPVNKNAFVKRYLVFIKYALNTSKYLRKQKDVDLVFVQSCPTAPFQITLAKIIVKKPIVYNIQDMFPGSSIASGVMKNVWMQKMFFLFQKIAYANADHITVISEDMKKRLIEQGVHKDKITTIVNWYDDQSVHEVKWNENRFVKKYNLSEKKFYVQYAGTMGFVFDYDMVLEVASILIDYSDIEFQMIGEGSQRDAFILEKENKNLDNIVFYPLEPQNMVSDVYSACSIAIIPLKRKVIGNSVPSKAGLLMACKRVIVNSVDEDSDYYRIFNDNKIGISASNIDPTEVAEAIIELYRNSKKRIVMAENGLKYAEKHYARGVNTKKYIELFMREIGE